MKINRICAAVIGFFVSLTCTTLVFASEENKQVFFTPEYRITEEFELPLRDLNSFECFSSPYVDIGYSYSEDVSNGTVRYISQMKQSKYFNLKYWGKWDGSTSIKCGNGSWYGGPDQECFTCSISMSLSYIGVNKTPEDILDFGGGLTIVNTSWGGATYKSSSFATAFDNYINGNGKYSPPIIHLNNYSYAGHYVVIIGKSSDNVYQVLDPAIDKVWEITISGSSATYTLPNGKTKSDTVSTAHQYYKESAALVKPFMCCIDTQTDSVIYESDVDVKGWAIYGKGITKVAGIVNGKNVEFTQSARLDVAKVYTGYPTGKEGFSGTVPAAYLKNGTNKLELYAYYNSESFHIGTLSIDFKNEVLPEISDVKVSEDVDGYTVTCKVSDDLGIDRVLFPTWTFNNGQDDIVPDWKNSELTIGSIEDGQVTYRVKRADHNNETGNYITHIYAFDVSGNYIAHELEQYIDDVAPAISSLNIIENQNGYTVSCTASDENGIGKVEYIEYKYIDDGFVQSNGGTMEEILSEDIFTDSSYVYSNEIEGEESCIYRIDVYVYDSYGNCSEDSVVVYIHNEQAEISPVTTSCGEELTYSISDDMILTISGTGKMLDWSAESPAPWSGDKNDIREIIIEEGVTGIGAEAFKNCINVKSITLPETLVTIGNGAFENTFSMEKITLPTSIVSVGDDAFTGCISLKNLIVLGKDTIIGFSDLNSTVVMAGYSGSSAEMFALVNSLTFIAMGGDLNSDGMINAADALLVLKHAAGVERLTGEILLMSADVNGDDIIDATDALDILKKAVGLK